MAKIIISADVHPTEDEKKVLKAIQNLFNVQLAPIKNRVKKNSTIQLFFEGDESLLNKFKVKIRQKGSQEILKILLERNKVLNTTYILLNKQAAFVGQISFCENYDESPLGSIKIEIECDNEDKLETIIAWLTAF